MLETNIPGFRASAFGSRASAFGSRALAPLRPLLFRILAQIPCDFIVEPDPLQESRTSSQVGLAVRVQIFNDSAES